MLAFLTSILANHHLVSLGTTDACQPCGGNKLSNMVKVMFSRIGVVGKTDHSLRATGASEMFQAGVLEKIVIVLLIKALCMYVRTTMGQHMAVSSAYGSVQITPLL